MLQIDDAGWGCPGRRRGGRLLPACRLNPRPARSSRGGEFVSGVIAPSYFQNDDAEEPNRYARRRYLDAAAQVASTCLARLKATPTEDVAVCSGHVLDGVRAWLTAQGYRWHAARTPALHLPVCAGASVTGALQDPGRRAPSNCTWLSFGFNVGYDLLTDHERAGFCSGGGRSSGSRAAM